MGLWIITIGTGGSQRTQSRVVDIVITEEFAHSDFSITIQNPIPSERTQAKGRLNSCVIDIVRGSTRRFTGFIEDVENGSDYVKYSGRSFLTMLGYSPNSETDGTSGDTKAEYSGQTGAVICDDLIDEFCHHVNGGVTVRDSTLTYSDITFTEIFDGEVRIHGAQKVYDVIKNMTDMYGKDLWADATWAGTTLTNKNIHIGEKSRGTSGSAYKTLRGGAQLAHIPVIKYRSSQAINCLRILGKGSGKEQISVWVEDAVSIAAIGYVEGVPYRSNLILSEDTATSIGNAIIAAKKDPIEELHVDPVTYLSDTELGDWIRIIDTYSNIDTIKRIKQLVRIYSSQSGDSMRIELGEKFDNYENIIRDLTKGDVNEEPEMVRQGGSLRLTANKPPSDYIRHDPGFWYDTTGAFQEKGKGVCPFWTYADNPAIGAFMKALVQISDAGSVTYKLGSQEVTAGAAEGTTVSVDALNTPLGEVILKGKSGVPGAYVVEDVYDDGNESYSYIYRDVRPIIGSSATGLGGSSPWEVSGSYSQLITARPIDMQGYDIINISDLKGSLNSDFSLYGSNSADSALVEFLQWDHSTEQILISRNTDLYDGTVVSPELKFRVPLDEGYSGFYVDYHSTDGLLRFRDINADSSVMTLSDTGILTLIDDLWMTKGKEINFGTPNTAYIYQDAATNDLKFYDSVLAVTKTLSELAGGARLWEVDGTETQLITADDIDMQDFNIIGIGDLKPQNPAGIDVDNSAGVTRIFLGLTDYAFKAQANGDMSGNNLIMGSGKITGLAAGTTAGDSVRYEQLIGAYLPLSGGAMGGNIDMNDNDIIDIGDMRPYNATGIDVDNSAGTTRIFLGLTSYAFKAQAPGDMSGNDLEMGSGDITQAKNIKGLTTGTDGADRLNLDFRGDGTHRIYYTGASDNKVQYKTFLSHEFVIQTTDVLEVKTTGIHMKAGKYLKSDSGDLELRAPSGSKIKFVIG